MRITCQPDGSRPVLTLIPGIALLILLLTFVSACDDASVTTAQPDSRQRQAVVTAFAEDLKAIRPEFDDIITILKDKRFGQLEQILGQAQTDYENGGNEYAVLYAFLQFDTKDESSKPFLNEWVSYDPFSWAARAARGIYLVREGWENRGYKFRSETPEDNIQRMHASFAQAEKDLEFTLQSKPRFMPAYKMLLQIGMNLHGRKYKTEIMSRALKHDPATYYVRVQYLWANVPKWGGSHGLMRRFARSAQKYLDKNPRLYALQGFEYESMGDIASREKQYVEAIRHYDTAIAYGPVYGWLKDRAWAYRKTGQFQKQADDLSQILEMNPNDHDVLGRRGNAYVNLGRYEEAVTDLKKAISLSSDYLYHRTNLGWAYERMHQYQNAIGSFEEALRIDADNAYSLVHIGWNHNQLQQPGKALPYLEKAVKVSPKDPQAWIFYGDALYDLGRPGHREALKTYLSLVRRNDPNEQERIRKVEAYLNNGQAP